MKKLILLIGLGTYFQAFSQTETNKVYEYAYGVKSVQPTKEIVVDKSNNRVEVYNLNYGVRDISPETIIEDNKVYDVNYGVRDLFPKAIIEDDDCDCF